MLYKKPLGPVYSNSNQWEFCLLYSWCGAPFWSQTVCHHHEHPGDSLILLAGLVSITQKEISIKPAMVSLEKTEELSNCSFFQNGPSFTTEWLLRFRVIPSASDTPEQSCSQWAIATFCPVGNFLSGKRCPYTVSVQKALWDGWGEEGYRRRLWGWYI